MEGKNNDRYQNAGISCTEDSLSIPLGSLPFAGKGLKVSCLYPEKEPVSFELDKDILNVHYDKPVMARLFEISF